MYVIYFTKLQDNFTEVKEFFLNYVNLMMILSRSLIVKILYIKNPHALNEEAVVKRACALLIFCLVNCPHN